MKIGIIGAMDIETEMLKKDMAVEKVVDMAGMKYYSGLLKGQSVVVVTCGIGKVNAAICTQILVNLFDVGAVINTGVSGAIYDELKIGDIVISTDCMEHDFDATVFGYDYGVIPRLETSVFKADEKLIDLAYSASQNILKDQAIFKGRVVSGDQFISSAEKKVFLEETFGAYTTEMEGAAIAHTCSINKVPFVIIRAMSDQANGEADVNFDEFAEKAAVQSNHIVLNMIDKLSESV